MKKIWIMWLLSDISVSLNAQYNLVPNNSFEIFDTCPFTNTQVRFAPPWINPLYPSSPDYLNACDTGSVHQFNVPDNYAGFQYAKTGVAYVLLVTYATNQPNPLYNYWREYVEVELLDSLKAGVDYCIMFYVSSADSAKYFSNNIGVYFSNTIVKDTCPQVSCNLPYIPQFENPLTNNLNSDTSWTLVSGSYTAIGGEKFIVIGNFRDNANTAVTSKGYGYYYGAAYYVDDILISPCDSLTGIDLKNKYNGAIGYPNPTNGLYYIKQGNKHIKEIAVYDIYGKLIFNTTPVLSQKFTIDIRGKPNGIYLIKILQENGFTVFKLIKY